MLRGSIVRMAAVGLQPHDSLESLRRRARRCTACPLYEHATQTVFGEGPPTARVVLIGEQPGDREDIEGHPFVGPAGRLLDRALEEAGIDRSAVYVTNAVKHFKFKATERKRRLHQKPNAREIGACHPWLEAELAILNPDLIIALGATAAQSLRGSAFRVTRERGKILPVSAERRFLATVHPSSILRAPTDAAREEAYGSFVRDLQVGAEWIKRAPTSRR